jgi:hypothetical protein
MDPFGQYMGNIRQGPSIPRFESITDLLCRVAARRVRQQPAYR